MGGRTPDDFPGPRIDDEVILQETGSAGIVSGSMRLVTGSIVFVDKFGEYDPRTGGSGSTGITADEHKTLRQLIHFLDDGPGDGFANGPYRESTPEGSLFPTAITWYTDAGKTQKLVEKVIVRSGSLVAPTPIIWRIYDTDGSTVLRWAQDDITYQGIVELHRSRSYG